MRTSRRSALHRHTLLCVAGVCLSTAAKATAQAPGWRLEPAIGVLVDAYDNGLDGNRAGLHGSLSLSRALGTRVRGVATISAARVEDVAALPASSPFSVRNDWVFAMAGPQFDVAVRRVGLSLALQGGAAWRRTATSGNPPAELGLGRDRWSVRAVLTPSAQVRIPLASRLAVTGGAGLYLLNVPERPRTSPAFTLGVAVRP